MFCRVSQGNPLVERQLKGSLNANVSETDSVPLSNPEFMILAGKPVKLVRNGDCCPACQNDLPSYFTVFSSHMCYVQIKTP